MNTFGLTLVDAMLVRELLPAHECIETMRHAMAAISAGKVSAPLRTITPLVGDSGALAVMPGSCDEPRVCGAKIVSLYPDNPARGLPAIQGFVVLFDRDSGRPAALVDGAQITALRTAAASALATSELARADARVLGVLGCGVQAAAHIDAIRTVRHIEEVRIWGRRIVAARALADRYALLGVHARAVESAQEAAASDIVCTVTSASQPVLLGSWVRPGTHVNLVGAHSPATRESDSALIARSRVYVDSLQSALSEAGDLLIPMQEGAIAAEHIVGEIGQQLLGRIEGRRCPEEITLYKSLGVVGQDLFAAQRVVERMRMQVGRLRGTRERCG